MFSECVSGARKVWNVLQSTNTFDFNIKCSIIKVGMIQPLLISQQKLDIDIVSCVYTIYIQIFDIWANPSHFELYGDKSVL